jgi:5-methylcytosine-specific restriction endonuclease McrA
MQTLRAELSAAVQSSHPALVLLVREPEGAWAAAGLTDLVPPATLTEARASRDDLARLLRREREAAADFLLALAGFDRRRGWERLGHASLFAFLTRELGLSKGAAYLRFTAARLLPRHPAVEAALRSGRLCMSAVGELARVLTPENEAEVLPRFLGCSAREAKEVAAALAPCPAPPLREVVTGVRAVVGAPSPILDLGLAATGAPTTRHPLPPVSERAELTTDRPTAAPGEPSPMVVRTSELTPASPIRPPSPQVEPLTADLRRLHLTVSRRLLDKVAAARDGLSHALPGATTEQVLEAALDLLLQQQARRRALVKRPRKAVAAPTSEGTPARPHVPAAVEREVRLRDDDRCQHPLDVGGLCGSTWQVELDHVVPVALGGPTTAANLRCACRVHNRYAAEVALGAAVMAGARRRRDRVSPRKTEEERPAMGRALLEFQATAGAVFSG